MEAEAEKLKVLQSEVELQMNMGEPGKCPIFTVYSICSILYYINDTAVYGKNVCFKMYFVFLISSSKNSAN